MKDIETIKINEIEYVRADSVQVKPVGNRAIIVVDRGWIFAGDVTRENGRIKLSRALRVFKWAKETEWWAKSRIEELERERDTAWAQAHRLALELECLIMDTKDNVIVGKWWDSAFEAIEEYNKLKPGAAEDAEAWAKMRKAGIWRN